MWFLQSVPAGCAVHLCWNHHNNLKTQLSFHPAAAAKFRRDSLFCPDELDSLFSYFDTGSGPRSKSPHSVHIQARCIFRICLEEQMNFGTSDGGHCVSFECSVIINVSVAWRCLAPQVWAVTVASEEALTAAQTSWFLVQLWTVSQKRVCLGFLLWLWQLCPIRYGVVWKRYAKFTLTFFQRRGDFGCVFCYRLQFLLPKPETSTT